MSLIVLLKHIFRSISGSRSIWICFFFCMLGNGGIAQLHEDDYQQLIRKELGGEMEVAVQSGYVDILTEQYAIEVEFANKWKQAIGQSIWYGMQTSKKPGIVLIKEKSADEKYVLQLGSALGYAGLSKQIKVWVWPDQFSKTRGFTEETQPASIDQRHWLTKSSGIRHNHTCRFHKTTKGDYCKENVGVACSLCGG